MLPSKHFYYWYDLKLAWVSDFKLEIGENGVQ